MFMFNGRLKLVRSKKERLLRVDLIRIRIFIFVEVCCHQPDERKQHWRKGRLTLDLELLTMLKRA